MSPRLAVAGVAMAARSDETTERNCGRCRATNDGNNDGTKPRCRRHSKHNWQRGGLAVHLFHPCHRRHRHRRRRTLVTAQFCNLDGGSRRQRATFKYCFSHGAGQPCTIFRDCFRFLLLPPSRGGRDGGARFCGHRIERNKCKAGSVELAMDASMIGGG